MEAPNRINICMPRGNTGTTKCQHCGKEISNFAYPRHVKSGICQREKKIIKRVAWNKDKTSASDPRVAANALAVGKTLKAKYASGELKMTFDEKTIKKISRSMKKAHAEGRAYSFAHNRGRAEPSYPEKFFAGIIEREFNDKAVEKEFKFFSYSLDFAWPHKKKVIEIDGAQHERFAHRRASDARKDKKLIENGWQVLRIKWKDMCNDTQHWIQIAKNFIAPIG